MIDKIYAVLFSVDAGSTWNLLETSADPRKMHRKAAFTERMNPGILVKCLTYDLGKEIKL